MTSSSVRAAGPCPHKVLSGVSLSLRWTLMKPAGSRGGAFPEGPQSRVLANTTVTLGTFTDHSGSMQVAFRDII